MAQARKILITAALPYANGDLHIGHLVEYCMADMWNRAFKMAGHESCYLCADDTHGTPIMLNAKKQGITPEAMIADFQKRHLQDFAGFHIEFDHFSSTNSDANKKFVCDVFQAAQAGGHIESREIEQAYCLTCAMFLPDRFVRGTCPKCKAPDQYGDNCEVCSATYSTLELVSPQCATCSSTPVAKKSQHLFFKLSHFQDFLKEWVPAHTNEEIARKLEEWLKADLQDWGISRDKPYFGFEIPGYEGKYFYVWMDAPVGYISTTHEWCEKTGKDFDSYWRETTSEVHHIIGKDIAYFHNLFWPALLKSAGLRTPTRVHVHGMLTVNGTKMSKSRGTSIKARTYLEYLDPMYLRYYLACKMSANSDDLDLNLQDFVSRVNSDLIGKITNIASRGAAMLQRLDGRLGSLDEEGRLLVTQAQKRASVIAALFEQREFGRAILAIREIADEANKYFDDYEPWKLVKEQPEKVRVILTTILNQFRIMAIYLKPILPTYTEKVEILFGEKPYIWSDAQKVLERHTVLPYQHLAQRVDMKKVEELVDASKEGAPAVDAGAAGQTSPEKTAASDFEALAPEIEIQDFAKLDLRVAKIIQAQEVAGADKLLQLTLDLGFGQRNVFAGIKSAYKPADLEGRLTVMVANLKPRKMKFGLSEGMVLAAGPGGEDIFILSPDQGAKPGQRVK